MSKELTFLVILDDTPEMYNALRYAAQRSARGVMVEWQFYILLIL